MTSQKENLSVNWDNFKCRCSAITKILTSSRSNPQLTEKQAELLSQLEEKETRTEKQEMELARLLVLKENSTKVILSDSCIEYLMDYYALKTEGIIPLDKELSDIPSLQKGKLVEADSILMLSRLDKVVYTKNDFQVFNDYLTGEPDVFIGPEIYRSETIVDMKNCWDYNGFLKLIHKAVEPIYQDQVNGYCDITGAKTGLIVRSVLSMPPSEVDRMKWKVLNLLGGGTDENPEFKAIWEAMMRSMDIDRIPIHKRIFKRNVEPWSKERRQAVYDRVKVCREWLWEFDEMYQNLNK